MADVGSPILDHWLLTGVSPEDLRPLLASAQQVRFLPGEQIFDEGDVADGLYLVTSGAVRVTAANDRGEVLLAAMGANDVLGEMGVLDGEARSGTAVAVDHCTAYFVPAERFLDTLEMSPRLCLRLLALMTERLRLANEPLKRYPRAVGIQAEVADEPPPLAREPRMPVAAPLIPRLLDSIDPRTPIRRAEGFYTSDPDSFTGWLSHQVESSGGVGELARYAADDASWPHTANDIDTLSVYLDLRGANPVVQSALAPAWRHWLIDTNRADHQAGSD